MEYNSNIPTYSSSLEVIDPSTLFTDGYELTNQTVIESNDYQGSFTPGVNNCEFYVYDANKVIITSNYNFTGLTIPDNPNPQPVFDPKTGQTYVPSTNINLNPEKNIVDEGFTFGKLYAVYNFVNLELGSSMEVPYYLAEISSDRTEIRLKSNFISTRIMKSTTVALKNTLSNPEFFDELYISFGNNEYHIGVNVKYDDSLVNQESNSGPVSATNAVGQASILIKLFDPLPSKYDLLDELYVCTKTAESQAYLVNFVNDFKDDDNIIKIKGPNSNLKIQDFVNNSSEPQFKNKLLGTKSSGSKDQLLNVLNQTGVQITPNYSTGSFGEFINFSSAKSQVSNFVEKVNRIQAYESDLDIISRTTSSNVGNVFISESIASLFTKIEDEITSFSGFEYYQYYSTGSDAYPKTGTVFPLTLLPTSSAQVWITSAEASGSRFDEDNQNWLYYTIPGFIKENNNNDNYLEFTNMVGQSFDEIWLYTKAIAERLNTTNDLDKGVPLQLADDVITSLGYTGFGNNYNNQDNFIGLIGNDNGLYVPPTGSELINHYIAVNGPGGVINYWEDGYSYEDYVESFENLGFPYPIDKVSKEIFKRLYHNMSYLVKKKGTVSGLRQLINIWGIPNTILRINEFGGKNKDEEDDYDLWYQRYSYAYTPVPAGTNYASSSVRIPWQPLYRNYIHSHNKLVSTSTITATGTTLTGATFSGTSANYGIDTQFTVTGGGSGGTLTLTADGGGNITTATLTQGDSGGYNVGSEITITAAQANALNDTAGIGTSIVGGPATFIVANANLGAEQIVPDGLGFRFKTTGYPSSSYGGNYDSQSLFIKKSTNSDTEADFGIILNYTGSTSGSHLGSTSSKYVDYGEMRFFLKGSQAGGDTALSPPIYLPFFDKGWWNVQLQRDEHPIVTNDVRNTTYTLYVANKIYDGADGNQIGFQGSASIYVNVANNLTTNGPGKGPSPLYNANSASVNASWNAFSLDLAQYGAGAYVGGWGNTLTTGETGSMGILADDGGSRTGLPKGIQNAGKNFSGSLQEFRYYSHDISQSVFNDAVMNPESIEGNFITGSESSFDIVNFRAPLGNELENLFTSSQYTTQYIDYIESVHPAITGSSPLIITASFYNPLQNPITAGLTSSYDVTYNVNSSTRTYSNPNVETYFLDQPSIGIRNRVSNKIKYSTNLNFGNTLSNKVSIQQDPPASQSYTDNINSLEVAFSPTEEINDDIIQTLGYGSIQEVIADPRFRSSSDDYYPGLQAISKDYFKKYQNRSQIDYLRLIKYFDDSLFRAIKNYVPARTSVSTGIVIKQHMLERNRYREPQVNIVTTQSYAPFNQPLTFKNLELTGSINTNQLWDPIKQTTYYSSSDPYTFSGGPGGSVNQYNVLEEGGSLFVLESDDLALTNNFISIFEAVPLEEVSKDIVLINSGDAELNGTATIGFTNTTTNQLTTTGASDVDLEDHAITIRTVNPSDGSIITKKYVTSDLSGVGLVGTTNQFIRFQADGLSTAPPNVAGIANRNAASLVEAINSVNGQGSGASTPTIRAEVGSGTGEVNLTQLYGGTDSNTTIDYGSKILSTIGRVTNIGIANAGVDYFPNQTITDTATTTTSGIGTGIKVDVDTTTNTPAPPATNSITNLTLTSTNLADGGSDYVVGDQFSIPNPPLVQGSFGITTTALGQVVTIASMLNLLPAAFTGGATSYSTFLNVHKSLRTPIYLDFDFDNFSTFQMQFQVSSSIRGIILTNTTQYTQADPPGSTLLNTSGEQEFIEMHPGEDIYMSVRELLTPNIIIDDYQIILGENIIITRALAAQTTSNSLTLLIDSFTEFPVVGSIVTGPDVKAGVVTTLGAVTNGGTGYTPSTTQVLATTGAGGGNLTLTVTTNSSGNVTTAALSNPGTGYTTNDVVTIVGGDNNATVAITVATSRTITVVSFDTTNNQVTFNELQSITDDSKITFTSTAIPDADTIPVSQQGYFTNTVTPLGLDVSWDDTQEQFYDGEYSGSTIIVDDYFREQYNPYKKVKPNSTTLSPTSIAVNAGGTTKIQTPGNVSLGPLAQSITFDTTNLVSPNDTYYVLAMTDEEIIPYQEYTVSYDVNFSTGGGNGAKVGMFLQNYNTVLGGAPLFTPVSSLITPQIVSEIENLSGGTGYSPKGNVATTTGGSGTGLTVDILTVDPGGVVLVFGAFTGGTGYPNGAQTGITTTNVQSDGTGLTVNYTGVGNAVTVPAINNGGTGYMTGDVVIVDGGNGDSQLSISTVNNAGQILTLRIDNPGDGNYAIDDTITISGGNANATFDVKNISSIYTNGVPESALVDDDASVEFTFRFLPPLDKNTALNGRYSLGFQFAAGYAGPSPIIGTISNITVTGIGGIYEDVKAPIFLTQQDIGYDNQADYQNMSSVDAQGNPIGGTPTKIELIDGGDNYGGGLTAQNGQSTISTTTPPITTGIGTGLKVDYTCLVNGPIQTVSISKPGPFISTGINYNVGDIITIPKSPAVDLATIRILQTTGEIHLIENTQSVVFNNSDYNPLSNNVNTNRSSSHRYVLSYGSSQSSPDNFALVVTQSFFPTSVSGTFPERADVPDSNYTMPGSVNSRYAGTKLKSLDYNIFTPQGSVGPPVGLPQEPFDTRNLTRRRVASEFLDGSVTSSFQQTLLGAGSASWQGDSKQQSGSSTIDKHPIYMARFENSYEQLNFYNSYQFNIDQLIEVPFEDIAGLEITPNSITIDGSNDNKKVVSSVFEPKRKTQVSYLNPKTRDIDYSTMQIGKFDIISGATEFLTINSNAKSRVSASLAYNYTRGGQLVTSSLTQDQGTIQMVTGSNTIGDPATEGLIVLYASSTINGKLTPTSTPTLNNFPDGIYSIPLTSVGGPGTGLVVQIEVVAGQIDNTYGGRVIDGGIGYRTNDRVQVNSSTLKLIGVLNGGNFFSIGVTGPLVFTIISNNIIPNPNLLISKGFLLSGSLTTGNIPAIGNSTLKYAQSILGTDLPGGDQEAGTIRNIPVDNFNLAGTDKLTNGVGLTVDITSNGTTVTSMVVNQGGTGYAPGDSIVVRASSINSVGGQFGAGRQPVFQGASDFQSALFTNPMLEGQSSAFQLNFNPTAVSSSLVTSSLAPSTVPVEQQLLIGGPQLAVFHAFNSVVSSSRYENNPAPTDADVGPTTLLWTTSGSNPSNVENYYNWAPESSDSNSYTNTNTPYLINRGDIIRVEGTLNTLVGGISSSTNIIENFTVEEVQDFTYTSSFSNVYNFPRLLGVADQLMPPNTTSGLNTNGTYTKLQTTTDGNGIGALADVTIAAGDVTAIKLRTINNDTSTQTIGNGYKAGDTITLVAPAGDTFIPASVTFSISVADFVTIDTTNPLTLGDVNTLRFRGVDGGAFSDTLKKGAITITSQDARGVFQYDSAAPSGNNQMQIIANSTGSANVSGVVTATIRVENPSTIAEWEFTGGSNIPEGTQFTIDNAELSLGIPNYASSAPLTFQMVNGCIAQQPQSNNFTIGVDIGGTAESGSQAGFHNYDKGEVGFTAPTFVRVTPDPETTLVGLPGGEVTKMTVRRQIEADDKVMVKNVTPPSGSLGISTPSGQGFLIPNDFSEVQKSNALNIINQLKAKNAFDKPNEPGITDGPTNGPTLGNPNDPGRPGGQGSGGGGGGGIQ